MHRNIAPCGSWKSPISSELITMESVGLDQVRLCDDSIYWLERRPAESGRCVIVCDGKKTRMDIIPPPYSARSRVHEYGGGVYCVAEHQIFFVNDSDQEIYRVSRGATPKRLTHAPYTRFADLYYDGTHNRILCVCEDHKNANTEPVNSLVAVDINTGTVNTLCHGRDFYSSPRMSPDAASLSWLCWDHPNMPWDGTELWLADVDESGLPTGPRRVAGSNRISVFQPEWSPDNSLYYVTDESGWWNLARLDADGPNSLTSLKSEFGLPQWVFGQSTYAFSDNCLYCSRITDGVGQLSRLDLNTLALEDINLPQNAFGSLAANNDSVCFIAASESSFSELIRLGTRDQSLDMITRSCSTQIDQGCISRGQGFRYQTRHHDYAYAIYYPPANQAFEAPPGEQPPLIVLSHGGPTGATDASLDLRKQYWTSRGFAIVDVNYSGSTGYGRAYRERLLHNWGIRDVDDVCDAALYLADKGLVDKNRLIIKGSSAGGYTVLAALTFHDTFSCGASYYGISDLEALLDETHKFESRYTDLLVGEYPENRQLYYDRSPIHFVDQLSCPVIFFQGLEDRVVPPSQAEKMVTALKSRGIAVSYVPFENEQHGFRQAATIKAALEAELYFYSVIFGFDTAEQLPRIPIANTDTEA